MLHERMIIHKGRDGYHVKVFVHAMIIISCNIFYMVLQIPYEALTFDSVAIISQGFVELLQQFWSLQRMQQFWSMQRVRENSECREVDCWRGRD